MYLYIYIYIYICVCVYTYIYIYICMCINVYIYVCVCVSIDTCVSTWRVDSRPRAMACRRPSSRPYSLGALQPSGLYPTPPHPEPQPTTPKSQIVHEILRGRILRGCNPVSSHSGHPTRGCRSSYTGLHPQRPDASTRGRAPWHSGVPARGHTRSARATPAACPRESQPYYETIWDRKRVMNPL